MSLLEQARRELERSERAAQSFDRKINGHSAASDPILTLRIAKDVKMESVTWLWSGWLAQKKLHVLAGPPGLGKTTIALSLAATVSNGGIWPDGTRCHNTGSVVIWSGEDDAEDTLAPRLTAMNADLSRISFVESVTVYRDDGTPEKRAFDPAQDVPLLIAKAAEIPDARLLIIDPVSLSVAGDSNKNSEVRRGLAPLVAFAEARGAAVVGISHFSKGTAGRDPLDRVTGSLAFGAAPRLVLGAARISDKEGEKPNEDRHVLVRIKSNIGPSGGAIAYQIDQQAIAENSITASRIVWGEMMEGTARDILAEAEQNADEHDERSAEEDAGYFLQAELSDGSKSAKALFASAREAGHSEKTIRRAARALGIRPRKTGMAGGWLWSLPSNMASSTAEGVQLKPCPSSALDGHLRDGWPSTKTAKTPEDGQDGHDFGTGGVGHLREEAEI